MPIEKGHWPHVVNHLAGIFDHSSSAHLGLTVPSPMCRGLPIPVQGCALPRSLGVSVTVCGSFPGNSECLKILSRCCLCLPGDLSHVSASPSAISSFCPWPLLSPGPGFLGEAGRRSVPSQGRAHDNGLGRIRAALPPSRGSPSLCEWTGGLQ